MHLRPILVALLASVTVALGARAADAVDPPAPTGATAASTIGGTSITLPVLPGYADPAATPKLLMEVMSNAMPPTNRLLSLMLQTDYLARIKAGDRSAPLSRYLAVQTFPSLEWSGIDPARFDQLKSVLRAQNAQMLEQLQPEIGAVTDRLSEDLGKRIGDSSVKIHTGDSSSLGVFDDQPDVISMAALQTVSATTHGNSEQVRQAIALGAIRLRGKLLMVSVYSNYASQADVDWVEGQVRAWVQQLRDLNP